MQDKGNGNQRNDRAFVSIWKFLSTLSSLIQSPTCLRTSHRILSMSRTRHVCMSSKKAAPVGTRWYQREGDQLVICRYHGNDGFTRPSVTLALPVLTLFVVFEPWECVHEGEGGCVFPLCSVQRLRAGLSLTPLFLSTS